MERILARERERESQDAEQKTTRLAELAAALAAKEAAANQLVQLAAQITSDTMREMLQKQMNELGAELDVLRRVSRRYRSPLNPGSNGTPNSRLFIIGQRMRLLDWSTRALRKNAWRCTGWASGCASGKGLRFRIMN